MTDEQIFELAEKHGDWDDFGRWTFRDSDKLLDFVAAINTPPKREWIGLTGEEAAECWSTSAVQTWMLIEAKLKEKNA